MSSKLNKSVRRRRSRSLIGFSQEDICQTIPTSLSPSERLLMLLERCFQYSLSAVKEAVSSNEGFDLGTFHQNGTECWAKIRTIIEEKNLIQSAVTENASHNESILSSDVESMKSVMSVYQAEHDKWNDIILSSRKSLEKKINSAYEVDVSKFGGEFQFYDYSDIKKCVSSSDEKLIDELSSLNKTIGKCLKFHETLHNAAVKKHDKYLKQNIQNTVGTEYLKQNIQDTAGTIMKRMATRRLIKPYSTPLSAKCL